MAEGSRALQLVEDFMAGRLPEGLDPTNMSNLSLKHSQSSTREALQAEVQAERGGAGWDLVVDGGWQGADYDGTGFLLTLRLRTLGPAADSEDGGVLEVGGSIEFHLVQVEERSLPAEYFDFLHAHIGCSGLERVRGRFDVRANTLDLYGYSVVDPLCPAHTLGILGVDEYHIEHDSLTGLFRGVTRNFHPSPCPSMWRAIFTGGLVQTSYPSLGATGSGPQAPAARRTYSGDGSCPICMEPYAHRALTPCGHAFCAACICEVLTASSSAAPCPICRETVTLVSLRNAQGEPIIVGLRAEEQRRPAP